MSFTKRIIVPLLGLLAVTAFALPSPTVEGPCCPDTFVTLEGRCLFVATDVYYGKARPRNYTESRELCKSFMSNNDSWTTDLASNVDESFLGVFTTYIVENIQGMKSYIFWIGVSKVNGVWQWLDGSPISNLSYAWIMSSPSSLYDDAHGMLVPAGAFNRFYINEYSGSSVGPSFLCEAKRRA